MDYRLGIYLNLPKEWHNKIAEIKKTMKPWGENSKNTTAPHLSLYLCKFDKENFSKLLEKLKTIKQKSFVISLDKITKQKNNFCLINVEPKNNLRSLHRKIVEKVNPLREGLIRKKDLQRIKDNYYSQHEIDNINNYGYALVKDLYLPHITLGVSEREDKEKLIKELEEKVGKIKNRDFLVKDFTIGLFDETNLDEAVTEKKIKLK